MATSLMDYMTVLSGPGHEAMTSEGVVSPNSKWLLNQVGKLGSYLPSLASSRPSLVTSRSPLPGTSVVYQTSSAIAAPVRLIQESALKMRHSVRSDVPRSSGFGLSAVEELVDGAVLFCFSAVPPQSSVQAFVSKSGPVDKKTMAEILAPSIQQPRHHNVSSDRSPGSHSPQVSKHSRHQSDPMPQWLNSFTTGLEVRMAALEDAYGASEPGLLHKLKESVEQQSFPLELSPLHEASPIADAESSEAASPREPRDAAEPVLHSALPSHVGVCRMATVIGAVALAQLTGIVSFQDMFGTARWLTTSACVRSVQSVLGVLPAIGLLCAGLLVHTHRQAALKLVGLSVDEKAVHFQVASLRTQCIWQVAAVVVMSAVLPVGATAVLSGISV